MPNFMAVPPEDRCAPSGMRKQRLFVASMSETARPALSIVAPCFNEEHVLPEFLQRVGLVLEGVVSKGGGTAEIVVVDDGSQDPPELLPEMIKLMDQIGADVVYGRRRQREGDSLFKRATAASFYRLIGRM